MGGGREREKGGGRDGREFFMLFFLFQGKNDSEFLRKKKKTALVLYFGLSTMHRASASSIQPRQRSAFYAFPPALSVEETSSDVSTLRAPSLLGALIFFLRLAVVSVSFRGSIAIPFSFFLPHVPLFLSLTNSQTRFSDTLDIAKIIPKAARTLLSSRGGHATTRRRARSFAVTVVAFAFAFISSTTTTTTAAAALRRALPPASLPPLQLPRAGTTTTAATKTTTKAPVRQRKAAAAATAPKRKRSGARTTGGRGSPRLALAAPSSPAATR